MLQPRANGSIEDALPSGIDRILHADTEHDHMVIGRNEIGVQHVARTFAARFDVPLG